jgi:sugar/nucleoside kinase (ribokinase family)
LQSPGKSGPRFELLCIGNAMVDIFTRAGAELMDRLGFAEAIRHVSSEEVEALLKGLGWKTNAAGNLAPRGGRGFTHCSGGGAANTAKIAALLGVKTGFTGALGTDSFGELFRREIAGAGVAPLLVPGKGKTGLCVIAGCPGGETRIAAAPGAALELSPEHISEGAVKNAGALVLDGYLLDRRPLIRRVLELSGRFGVPVALDAASVFHVREKAEEILQYSRNYPLMLFMNGSEAAALYQHIKKEKGVYRFPGEQEYADWIIREICPVFQRIAGTGRFPLMAVKLGSQGAVIIGEGGIHRAETVPVKSRDSTGAGDAFCAAFLAGRLRGKTLAESAALGNLTARKILAAPGSRIARWKLAWAKKILQKN